MLKYQTMCFISSLQPPMDEGGRKRHPSSGDGRRRHPSQPSSRTQTQGASGPALPAGAPPTRDDAKTPSQRTAAADAKPPKWVGRSPSRRSAAGQTDRPHKHDTTACQRMAHDCQIKALPSSPRSQHSCIRNGQQRAWEILPFFLLLKTLRFYSCCIIGVQKGFCWIFLLYILSGLTVLFGWTMRDSTVIFIFFPCRA